MREQSVEPAECLVVDLLGEAVDALAGGVRRVLGSREVARCARITILTEEDVRTPRIPRAAHEP